MALLDDVTGPHASSDSGVALKPGFLLGAKSPRRLPREAVSSTAAGDEGQVMPSIDELLRRPDAEFTQWALKQAEKVVDPHIEVEQLEVFKYARAFAAATSEQRQELMDKGLSGFKKLPANGKSKALRFFMKHGDIMEVLLEAVKKADPVTKPEHRQHPSAPVQEPAKSLSNPGTPHVSANAIVEPSGLEAVKKADPVTKPERRQHPSAPVQEPAKSLSNLGTTDVSANAIIEPSGADAASEKRPREKDVAARRESSDGMQRGFLLKEKHHSAGVRNIRRVAKEAGFDKRPLVEDEALRATVRDRAPALLRPGEVLNAVGELNEEERAHLAETLIRTCVIPAIRRGDLLAAMRPGGFTDKLKQTVKVAGALYRYAWFAIAVCAVESFPFPGREEPCAFYLELWLRMDSLLWTAAVIVALAACKALRPVAHIWGENAVGTAFRFREAMTQEESWRDRLGVAFPGVEFESFKAGTLRTFIVFVLLFFAAGWAGAGVGLCLWAVLTQRCTGALFWVGVTFVVLRAATTAALVAPAVVFRRWYRLRYEEREEDPERGKKKKKKGD